MGEEERAQECCPREVGGRVLPGTQRLADRHVVLDEIHLTTESRLCVITQMAIRKSVSRACCQWCKCKCQPDVEGVVTDRCPYELGFAQQNEANIMGLWNTAPLQSPPFPRRSLTSSAAQHRVRRYVPWDGDFWGAAFSLARLKKATLFPGGVLRRDSLPGRR